MGAWDVKIVVKREYSMVIEAPTADDAQSLGMSKLSTNPENADESTFEMEITRRPS